MEKAEGILIRKTPLTDTSLITHWCTREHGLIRTAARGARRPGSPFAGKLDLFYSAEIEWTRSRRSDLHALREAHVTDFRQGLQSSWPRILCASYFVRLIETVAEAETPIDSLHDLLRRALDYLAGRPPTLKAVLHFERELAADLGILGEEAPIAALERVYHKLPEQRGAILRHLQGT